MILIFILCLFGTTSILRSENPRFLEYSEGFTPTTHYEPVNYEPITLKPMYLFKIRYESKFSNCSVLEIFKVYMQCKGNQLLDFSTKTNFQRVKRMIQYVLYMPLHYVLISLVLLINILDVVVYSVLAPGELEETLKPTLVQNKLVILSLNLDYSTLIYAWIISILLTIILMFIKFKHAN